MARRDGLATFFAGTFMGGHQLEQCAVGLFALRAFQELFLRLDVFLVGGERAIDVRASDFESGQQLHLLEAGKPDEQRRHHLLWRLGLVAHLFYFPPDWISTICVCVTIATSFPSAVVTRVCHTIVRRPR